jgi:hypothetical protein
MENGHLQSPTTWLTESEVSNFQVFFEQCQSRGLLDRPQGMALDDVPDGVNDETTLLYDLSSLGLSDCHNHNTHIHAGDFFRDARTTSRGL